MVNAYSLFFAMLSLVVYLPWLYGQMLRIEAIFVMAQMATVHQAFNGDSSIFKKADNNVNLYFEVFFFVSVSIYHFKLFAHIIACEMPSPVVASISRNNNVIICVIFFYLCSHTVKTDSGSFFNGGRHLLKALATNCFHLTIFVFFR